MLWSVIRLSLSAALLKKQCRFRGGMKATWTATRELWAVRLRGRVGLLSDWSPIAPWQRFQGAHVTCSQVLSCAGGAGVLGSSAPAAVSDRRPGRHPREPCRRGMAGLWVWNGLECGGIVGHLNGVGRPHSCGSSGAQRPGSWLPFGWSWREPSAVLACRLRC